MKKMKRLATLALAGVMAASMVFPSIADEQVPGVVYEKWHDFGDGTGYMERYASGKGLTLPGWVWVNGYCYYYTDYIGGNKLTNCVTPDGYTVDAEGRWTENGIPQSNGYTTYVMNTDTLYAGLNDEQRWNAMEQVAESVFLEHNLTSGFRSLSSSIQSGYFSKYGGGGRLNLIYDSTGLHTYVYSLYIDNFWNDAGTYANGYSESVEKIIKLLVGDHVGQELFNDIKVAAEPSESTDFSYITKFDENGKWIWIDSSTVETYKTQASDGINEKYFNFNKWNDRTTDYGKRIFIEGPSDSWDGCQWVISVVR